MASPKKLLAFLLALSLIAAACGSSSDSASPVGEEATTELTETEETEDDVSSTDDGSTDQVETAVDDANEINGGKPEVTGFGGDEPTNLLIEDFITGEGNTAESGDLLVMHYVGVLHEDGSQFDASWDRGQTFSFVLGEGSVIQGWDEGIVGMTEGSRRQLTIPPAQAYGDNSPSPDIPNGSTLVFVVDLLGAYSPHEVELIGGESETLEVTVIEEGDGPEVAAGDAVEVLYSLAPVSAGEVVQSSWSDGSTATFLVGTDPAEIFLGWSEGIVGLNVGDVARIVIPPALGPDPSQEDPIISQVTVLNVLDQ